MRRWLTAAAVGGVAALAMSGCLNPAGVDGELTDDWAAFSEPGPFTPAAGSCHPKTVTSGSLDNYDPVDCATRHDVETIHLGTFTGEHAEGSRPPSSGSEAMRVAFGECDKKVTEALGADWRSARLSMTVLLPSSEGWSGGSRWYRCDVSEVKSLDDDTVVARTGSLKGALADSSPLSYGCFNPKMSSNEGYIEEMVPVECDQPHHSEFVGVYTAPDTSYDAFDKDSDAIHKKCLALVAEYADVPNDSKMSYRSGTIFYSPSEREWEDGNRGVQCFLWLSKRKLNESMKGAGDRGLPAD